MIRERYHWKDVGDEILYVHIYIQLQEQLEGKPRETLRKYETRELDPKIDHKISSTNGPKERYSKTTKYYLKIQLIVMEEIVICTT